jgi:hypothetical protein
MSRQNGKQTGQGDQDSGEPLHVALAGEVLLAGMTRERVIAQLLSCIRRDESSFA